MSGDHTLVFYLNIADEDGPMFHLGITANQIDYGAFHTKVISIKDMEDIGSSIKYGEAIRRHKIVDAVEIHDWYDYLSEKDIIEEQKRIDLLYSNPVLPAEKDKEYIMVTIVQYCSPPRKYIIAKNEYVRYSDFEDFKMTYYKHEVTASYYTILTNFYIVAHNYYILDGCGEDGEEFCTIGYIEDGIFR